MRKGSETNIPKNLLISCSYELCSFHDYNKHCKYLYAASQVVSFVLSRSIFNFPHSAFTVQRHRALHTLLSKLLHRLNNKWIKFSLTLIMSLFINLSVTVINSVTEQKKKKSLLAASGPTWLCTLRCVLAQGNLCGLGTRSVPFGSRCSSPSTRAGQLPPRRKGKQRRSCLPVSNQHEGENWNKRHFSELFPLLIFISALQSLLDDDEM